MNARNVLRMVLLAVVASAVGIWAIREFGPSRALAGGSGREQTTVVARPDGVTVISFHGKKRCHTCIRISELAQKTLNEEFAEDVKAGRIRWEQIDFEEPANSHYVGDYGLVSSTVLATLWKDGRELKWNRFDAVWDHVGDEATFRAYLARGVRELLNR